MAQPYIGEIRMFAGNFAPNGWAFCSGQLMAISQNESLFTLIGTTYGGDGETTFGLPDLRGRLPIHQGSGFTIGQLGGSEEVTLTTPQLPAHTHPLMGSDNVGSDHAPKGNVLAEAGTVDAYVTGPPFQPLSGQAVSSTGGSQPHENLQPFLCVNFIISLFGIFPPQN